jgi:ABC-2 type transport system permease protein
MRYLRLVGCFVRSAAQNVMAYRANFWISLLHSFLNVATGWVGIAVLFEQVESVHGWTEASTTALLGVYLTLMALFRLFIGPSLDAIAGMEGAIHTGQFDFTLLRPVETQFFVSVQVWRPLALLDLLLGLGVLGVAVGQLGRALTPSSVLTFVLTLGAGLVLLYALWLAANSLVFWSPGFMITWVFNGFLQMARYPVGLYPGWLRLVLTWVVPVGLMTTVPARALTGALAPGVLVAALALACAFFLGASVLFRLGLRRYASASS